MAKLSLTKLRNQGPLVGHKLVAFLLIAGVVVWIFGDVNLVESLQDLRSSREGGEAVFVIIFTTLLTLCLPLLTTMRMMIDNATKKLKSTPGYFRRLKEISHHELVVPVLRPNAWRGLSESLDCMIVKVPDRRRAVWNVDEIDEKNLTLSASLLYTPEPLGRKRAQIYPRRMHLKARVEGFGVSSKLFLVYSVDSPMDLGSVKELITKTNNGIVSHMMAAESEPSRLPEFAVMNFNSLLV